VWSTKRTVIDAPSDLGLRQTGVDRLPDALRAAGVLEGLPDTVYAARLPVPPYVYDRDAASGVLNLNGIRAFSEQLARRVTLSLDDRRFPLVLGGDCSILLGSTLALRRRGRYGLFFFDGHADFYSPEAEPSGEVASMDLAIVTGHGPASLADPDGLCPLVRESDTVVFGYRDAEAAQQYGSPDVRQTRMQVFGLGDVRRLQPAEAARTGLAALEGSGMQGFWIHLDADVLHDDVMPAVDYRMPDGLWPEELKAALEVVLVSPLAMGMEITIYNPALDDERHSAARVLADTVAGAFAAVTG
jgi:arginase